MQCKGIHALKWYVSSIIQLSTQKEVRAINSNTILLVMNLTPSFGIITVLCWVAVPQRLIRFQTIQHTIAHNLNNNMTFFTVFPSS